MIILIRKSVDSIVHYIASSGHHVFSSPCLALLFPNMGFTLSLYILALFIYKSITDLILVLLYVDDMIITGNDTADI